jgi:hypothetical protein
LQTVQAQFALPFYEPFPATYTNGGAVITVNGVDWVGEKLRLAGNPSALVWTMGSTLGNGNLTNVGGAALTYSGLYQTSGSVGLRADSYNVTGGRDSGVALVPTTSGKLYTSFLLNVQAWPTNMNRPVCVLNNAASITGSDQLFCVISTTNVPTAGISNRVYLIKHASYTSVQTLSNVPPEAPTITAGTTHLIVMRYTFNPALTNDDEFAMWVDPVSLGVAEGSVPAPATTTTGGIDQTSISSFWLFQHNASTVAGSGFFIDEIRVGTTWKDVTPTGPPCNSVFINSNPTNISVVEGGMATFTTIGGGTAATFQWQVSTDGGGTWTPLSQGFGTNLPSLSIPSVAMYQNGNKYRCRIDVGCNSTTTNSTAATLTVTAPTVTAPGVLVDDFFMKRDRLGGPVNSTNSVWVTDVTASLYENADPDPVMLVGKPQDGSACLWLGYFVESNTPPVHLDVGRVLKATLVYTTAGTVSGTNAGLRMGLYDHYDAGIRLTSDGPAVKNSAGFNVRGYMFQQDWENPFNEDQPQTVYARNNMADNNLMGTVGDYVTLAHSAAGYSNAPGFSDGTTYTMDLYVARMTTSRCSVCMSITGGGTNYTTTAADRDYGYHRFDFIAVRPNSQQTTATEFDISEFKVQVLDMPARPTLNIARSGPNVILSWTNPAIYAPFVLEQAPAVGGPWSFVTGGATSPYTTGVTNAASFFRLEWP